MPTRADIFATYEATTTIASDSDAPVVAKVGGEVVELFVEEGDRHVQKTVAKAKVTGVVHKHIQPARLPLDECERARHVVFASDICRDRQVSFAVCARVTIESPYDLFDLLRRTPVDEDRRTVAPEDLRDAQSGVACGASYQNTLAFKHCRSHISFGSSKIRFGLGWADVGQVAAVMP